MNTAPLSELDPVSVLNYGHKVDSIGVPENMPRHPTLNNLYAVITSSTSQKAKELASPSEYNQLYAQSAASGCPFTVALYFADPAKLIYL